MEDIIKKGLSDLKSDIQTEIKGVEAKAVSAAQEAVKSAVEPVEAVVNEVKGNTAKMQEQLDDISTKLEKSAIQKSVSTKGELRSALEEGFETLKKMKGRKSGESYVIELKNFTLKEPIDMNFGDSVDGQVPQAERIVGLNGIPVRPLSLLSLAQFRNTSSNKIEWVYKLGAEGDAGQTAEGADKNQRSWEMKVDSVSVKKTTAYTKVTDEMLEDIDFLLAEIQKDLADQLLRAVEDGVLRGDGEDEELLGLIEMATTFDAGAAAGTITNPNAIDVIDAAKVQVMSAFQSTPNYVLMNPYDVLALRAAKVDNESRNDYAYRAGLIVENGVTRIAGLPVVETFLMEAGEFVVGDFTKFNIAQKKGLNIEIGYDGNDFTKNFKTILCEWRGASYIKTNDRAAFVTGDIETAIEALAAS
jgi:HK97 family phage major capsid protein